MGILRHRWYCNCLVVAPLHSIQFSKSTLYTYKYENCLYELSSPGNSARRSGPPNRRRYPRLSGFGCSIECKRNGRLSTSGQTWTLQHFPSKICMYCIYVYLCLRQVLFCTYYKVSNIGEREQADAGRHEGWTRLARPNSLARTGTGKCSVSLFSWPRAELVTLRGWSKLC